MKRYIKQFRRTAILTDNFKTFLLAQFVQIYGKAGKKKFEDLQFDKWIETPGLPIVENNFSRYVSYY